MFPRVVCCLLCAARNADLLHLIYQRTENVFSKLTMLKEKSSSWVTLGTLSVDLQDFLAAHLHNVEVSQSVSPFSFSVWCDVM